MTVTSIAQHPLDNGFKLRKPVATRTTQATYATSCRMTGFLEHKSLEAKDLRISFHLFHLFPPLAPTGFIALARCPL